VEPPELRALVAKNIRAYAKEKGMTLNRLADFAGVSKAQLYNVLRSSSSPSTDWLAGVANVLEVEPWQLLAPRSSRKSTRVG